MLSTLRPLFVTIVLTILFLLSTGCQANSPTLIPDSELPSNPQRYGGELTLEQQIAQQTAVQAPQLQEAILDDVSKVTLRSEVFGVYPARESDLQGDTVCPAETCYRVDVYNYAKNATYSLIVDTATTAVVQFTALPNVQPEIPPHLADLAVQIATTAPEVKEALGFDPAPEDPTMPNVKTALNNTACEQSRHLCVAPTFLVGERALWAIVDLTDEKLVGVRWTELGESGGVAITQQSIAFEELYANYCATPVPLVQNGWELAYQLTGSDGLALTDVRFNGREVVESIKLVDWHVNYSEDGFGYSDAIGCPVFSSASVVASGPPTVNELIENGQNVGFVLKQDYVHPQWPRPCNYRYQQKFLFYNDGRFRVVAENHGRGCGNNGTYRPLLRFQWPRTAPLTFAEWDGTEWQTWQTEQWQLQTDETLYTAEGYQYRLTTSPTEGYYIESGQGQFPYNRGGDNAYTYITNYNPDEGEADLLTLGGCCNEDYQQGPEQFVNNEPLRQTGLVMWYVPQLENDDTSGHEFCWADSVVQDGLYGAQVWPCAAGPLFVPLSALED